MTDKEIIIDGIDVSGCKELQTVVNEEPFCDSSNTLKILCRGNNCIYKQLKRLEAENAELKAENERLKEENFNFEEIVKLCRCEQYHQTLQEIKKIAELPSYHSKLIFNEFESRLYKIIDIITKAESEG